MKNIFFLALLVLGLNAKAQITLEYTYDSAATYNYCAGVASQLMIIKFEVSGERYVRINRCGKFLSIYDLNHSLLKNISLAGLPQNFNSQVGPILYLSENLFNTDSQFEFMYIHDFTDSSGNGSHVTDIYNESLSLLFTDTSAAWIIPNIHLQQYPIYNTSAGTKMILSCSNSGSSRGNARVFSLPGTLTLGIEHGNELLQQNNSLSNPYPNPTNSTTRIDFVFPDGVNQGEIVFYDTQGKEIKRFKVDKTFDHLLISTADIPAGTYFYQLQTSVASSQGKKMVVVK